MSLLTERASAVNEHLCIFADQEPGRSVACALTESPTEALSFNTDVVRPAASVIKLPLALTIEASAARGEINLDQRIMVSEVHRSRYPSALAAFDQDSTLTLRELSRFSLLSSDNDAANHLLQRIGADTVNQWLRETGCPNSQISVGFSDQMLGASGLANVSTTSEALLILQRVNALPEQHYIRSALVNNLRNQRIPRYLRDEVAVAHKTGSLVGIANDVGIVYGCLPISFAFFTEAQADRELTEQHIGQCVRGVLQALNLRDLTE